MEIFSITAVLTIGLGVLAAISLLLFFPLNTRRPHSVRMPGIERYIPFVPAFIVPYLALFPFVTATFFIVLLNTPVALRFYVSCIIAGIIAAVIWYFFPTGVGDRPKLTRRGVLTRIVAWTYAHDPRSNAIPSSHIYTTFLSSYYLTFLYPSHEILIWSIGSTIMSSTLLVKQHYLIDLVAGFALACLSIGASYLLLGTLA